ncbi:MAG: hypothetical protein H0X67_17620 [Acidobacteria bacterium]|nr:hypothetical protein [Acidobacteriota bacterium]
MEGGSLKMDEWMSRLIAGLSDGQTGEVAGSRGAVDVSLSERLLNQAVTEKLPPGGAVQQLTLRFLPGQVRVTVRLARPRFVPPVTLPVTIERQADLPASPLLVLRVGMPPGLGLLVGLGANIFNALPPGLRLEGERLTVDLAFLLRQQNLDWLLRYARTLLVTFEEGRVRIQGSAALE